jgi:hypothetical protein
MLLGPHRWFMGPCHQGRDEGVRRSRQRDAAARSARLHPIRTHAVAQRPGVWRMPAGPVAVGLRTLRGVVLPVTAQTVATADATPSTPSGQPLFKSVPTMVVSTEPLPGHMEIGGPIPTSVYVRQSAPPAMPGTTAAPPGPAISAPDPNVASRRAPTNHRGFADDAPPQRAQNYQREGPGTPRYNLLLGLGGVY